VERKLKLALFGFVFAPAAAGLVAVILSRKDTYARFFRNWLCFFKLPFFCSGMAILAMCSTGYKPVARFEFPANGGRLALFFQSNHECTRMNANLQGGLAPPKG
jgi:hypothetical protein